MRNRDACAVISSVCEDTVRQLSAERAERVLGHMLTHLQQRGVDEVHELADEAGDCDGGKEALDQ